MVARELASLVEVWDEAEELGREPTARLYAVAEHISEWSVAQHLQHTARVANLSLENVARLARGEGDPGGRPNANGRLALMAGRIPRGVGVAPPPAVPDARPSPEELSMLLRETGRTLRAKTAEAGMLGEMTDTLPHHHFDRLTPVQWLRFAWIHTRHHLKIIREILDREE